MMVAQQKKLVEVFGIFESLLTQNPTNQDSELFCSFKLYGRLLVNLKTGVSRKIFLPENDFEICFTKPLMPFIVLQTFKVKLLFENSLWRNILIHLKTKVKPRNPLFLHFLQYGPEDVRVLINLIFFSFGLAGEQKSFNAVCNHVFLAFLSSHYGFLDCFQLFSFFFQ